MRENLERVIELPQGATATVHESSITINSNNKEAVKKFALDKIKMSVDKDKIKLSAKNATRRESKIIGTINAHIKNMIKGLTTLFSYKLEICNVHFPMNVKVEGNKLIIKSFLGEKVQRVAQILPHVEVDVKGNQITVSSHSIENAGQTAANIEKATRLTGRDRRIFQDGIFITEKNGRKI